MKRRGYLLLELMMGLALVTMCALPLVRNPLSTLKGQVRAFEKAELQRVAQVYFAEIKAKIYQGEIKWEALAKDMPKRSDPADEEEVVTLQLAQKKSFRKKVFFGCVKESEGKNKEELKLVKVKIAFESVKKKGSGGVFEWLVFVKRGGAAENPEVKSG